jgi:hypothetical protein
VTKVQSSNHNYHLVKKNVIWQGYLSLFTLVTETQSTTATAVAATVYAGNPHALRFPINLIKKHRSAQIRHIFLLQENVHS